MEIAEKENKVLILPVNSGKTGFSRKIKGPQLQKELRPQRSLLGVSADHAQQLAAGIVPVAAGGGEHLAVGQGDLQGQHQLLILFHLGDGEGGTGQLSLVEQLADFGGGGKLLTGDLGFAGLEDQGDGGEADSFAGAGDQGQLTW